MKTVLKKFPNFENFWVQYCDEFGRTGLSTDMAAFSDYAMELLEHTNASNKQEIKEIFDCIEEFLVFGNQEVQDAAATCFLENISNRGPDKIPPSSFVPLLGKKSREYLRAWDEFTGVKTEGLW